MTNWVLLCICKGQKVVATARILRVKAYPSRLLQSYRVLTRESFCCDKIIPEVIALCCYKNWGSTWSLEWWSCRGRARRETASDEAPGADCRGAPSTFIAETWLAHFHISFAFSFFHYWSWSLPRPEYFAFQDIKIIIWLGAGTWKIVEKWLWHQTTTNRLYKYTHFHEAITFDNAFHNLYIMFSPIIDNLGVIYIFLCYFAQKLAHYWTSIH